MTGSLGKRRTTTPKTPPNIEKKLVCLNKFCCMPGLCHAEEEGREGRSLLQLFKQNVHVNALQAGKKKAYTALLQCRTFLCRKKWGPQRKDFGGGYGFPGFYRVCVSTTGLESFSLRPEKFSKRFSFGGGCVRFFLLCAGH